MLAWGLGWVLEHLGGSVADLGHRLMKRALLGIARAHGRAPATGNVHAVSTETEAVVLDDWRKGKGG